MKKLKQTKILTITFFTLILISTVNPVFAGNFTKTDDLVNSEFMLYHML